MTSYVSQGGAINRILEIECGERVYEDPQYTAEFLKKNYGFAGKRFVKILKAMDTEELREMQQEIQAKLFSIEKMQKQSISMSVILLADKIATEYLFYDEQYISVEEAKKALIDKNELSENERCYHYLLDKINMNRQRFDSAMNVEQWGIIEDGYAIMYPQAVRELCKQGDFSYKAFLNWADRQGVILTDGKNHTKLKKFGKKPVRCVFLQLNEFMDRDGFEPVLDVDQEELPFK